MISTFQKEITFVSIVPNSDGGVNQIMVTKKATFKELSKIDKSQHKLHFKLLTVFEQSKEEGENQFKVDSDGIYDLTVKAINTLLICDDEFKEFPDKKEFLSDSSAIFNFGLWLLNEKIAPFFSTFNAI